MALEIGSRLGHYDVTALIGEGGMGEPAASDGIEPISSAAQTGVAARR